MELKKFFSKGENLFMTGVVLILAAFVVFLMVGDVSRMQAATTKYEIGRASCRERVSVAV